MADSDNLNPEEQQYVTNKVPKVLMAIYGIFITWALFYFFSYSLPDLTEWLNK
ncbi:MAG: hypothetical protein H7A33_00815 [Deltaproteobacteria bacterium]|nr:hypothetical protein [Deltaproteobacteria bacterium]